MGQQIDSTNDVESPQVVHEHQTYRTPEVVDLGKASELLQGGACTGRDHAWATYC
jgi:hypothetical protein